MEGQSDHQHHQTPVAQEQAEPISQLEVQEGQIGALHQVQKNHKRQARIPQTQKSKFQGLISSVEASSSLEQAFLGGRGTGKAQRGSKVVQVSSEGQRGRRGEESRLPHQDYLLIA